MRGTQTPSGNAQTLRASCLETAQTDRRLPADRQGCTAGCRAIQMKEHFRQLTTLTGQLLLASMVLLPREAVACSRMKAFTSHLCLLRRRCWGCSPGGHSLNKRLSSRWGVVRSAAATHSTTAKPDVFAWWKLHLRVHAAHLLVHLADAALLTVTWVGLAPDRWALEANRLHAATHLARRETERSDVWSARLLCTEASHARVHVLLHLLELVAGRHAVKRLTQASKGSRLNGLSQIA